MGPEGAERGKTGQNEYITHNFQIQLKHNLSVLNEIKQGQIEFNRGKIG